MNLPRSLLAAYAALTLAACTLGPAAPATTALPYTDDFANVQSGWQTMNDPTAEMSYANGQLRILVKQQRLTQWSLAGKSFADAVFEVDATPLGGPRDNGYGILFRVKDRKNFYYCAISSDSSWQCGVTKDGTWKFHAEWQPHPFIKPDTATNRLKIVMKGDVFTLFVNEQKITEFKDASFSVGDIGVFAMTLIDAPGTDIGFDNVSVTEAP
jgi:hypothetical protein